MHASATVQKQKFPHQHNPKNQEVASEAAEASFATAETSEVSSPRYSMNYPLLWIASIMAHLLARVHYAFNVVERNGHLQHNRILRV